VDLRNPWPWSECDRLYNKGQIQYTMMGYYHVKLPIKRPFVLRKLFLRHLGGPWVLNCTVCAGAGQRATRTGQHAGYNKIRTMRCP